MFSAQLHQLLKQLQESSAQSFDANFVARLSANFDEIATLYTSLYGEHSYGSDQWRHMWEIITQAHLQRHDSIKKMDEIKLSQRTSWYLDNKIAGMSLYVDRFNGDLKGLGYKLDYFDELGVNFLHLMPVMESPQEASDGGYAVSDFRTVEKRFGTINDLRSVVDKMRAKQMYLMLDIVLNHTSFKHEWALKAAQGNKKYQEYFYMYDDRTMPDMFERTMPEVFPESSPGSFTYEPKSGKWVMTVFNSYQWDLNFTNPAVFVEMLDNIFFYGNLGVDILRIDAPAFIWKTMGTTCQNLPQAHQLLQLYKLCVQIATPGMALLGEAIVAPKEIMRYFGVGPYYGKECDIAYNATHMALQWDALATGDTRVMMGAQHDIMQKPYGVTWLNYTRCHDDIGLGYEDAVIAQAGWNPKEHRRFLKNYYSGKFEGSPATGALFGVNDKTDDARISGSLASLCGLEYAINNGDKIGVDTAINKILMMQAMSIMLGGIPMLFYGDEMGYTNDYTYLNDPGKSYDNRWMHRPVIDWAKNAKRTKEGTIEQRVFDGTKRLLDIRKSHDVFADYNNVQWIYQGNNHLAIYIRTYHDYNVACIYNMSQHEVYLRWQDIVSDPLSTTFTDLWSGIMITATEPYHKVGPFGFMLLRVG